MFLRGVTLAFVVLLGIVFLAKNCDAQLTFTPGWRNRILSKEISARADHSGKRTFWNSRLQSNLLRKRSSIGESGEYLPQMDGQDAVSYEKELDRACRLLEMHIARVFLIDGNSRVKMLWENLWERLCDPSNNVYLDNAAGNIIRSAEGVVPRD